MGLGNFLALAAVSLGLLAVTSTAAAQDSAATSPPFKVSIAGLIDQVTAWSRNMSMYDQNLTENGDREWYGRTRGRFDFIAEVGTTKGVIGFEADLTYGQTGASDSSISPPVASFTRPGTSGGFDLNTDVRAILEIKWLFLEFAVPLVPLPTTAVVGAQPFDVAYKPGVYATGDFAGLRLRSAITRDVIAHFTYAQVEEGLTGRPDVPLGQFRGDDFAIIAGVEFFPRRGLALRPLYSLFYAEGSTSFSARAARGGVTTGINPQQIFPDSAKEYRHTVGVDARWTFGDFYLDPTAFYQFGSRESVPSAIFPGTLTIPGFPANPYVNRPGRFRQGISAWFVDVRGGWRWGPWLLEGAAIYTTGNKAQQDIRNGITTIRHYQPLDTDTTFYAGWAEILALGVDYIVTPGGFQGNSPGAAIGYDKFGLARLGARATYAITPSLSVRGLVTLNWAAEKTDTRGDSVAGAAGIIPSGLPGTSRYLGTELDLGVTWSFAPGLTFDLVGAYMFAGDGLATARVLLPGAESDNRNPKDVQLIAARVRYTF